MTVHSIFGASGIRVVRMCPASIRMQATEPNVSGDAANLGTCAHEASEFALKAGCATDDLVGLTFNNIEVTQVMADHVYVYVNKVRDIMAQHPDAVLYIEKRVTMSSVSDDVFGTADCIIYVPSLRMMYVIDLKYGFGVVDVDDNDQIAHYSVSALDTLGLWDLVDTVKGMINQPRADHIDGAIRTSSLDTSALRNWQLRFKNVVTAARDPDAKTVAGEHCNYCRANYRCRARMIHTLDLSFPDSPIDNITVEQMLLFYKEFPMIKRQMEAVENRMLELAKTGTHIEGHKLVKAREYHSCTNEVALYNDLKLSGFDVDLMYNKVLKGKTDLKSLSGIDKKIVDKHFTAPPTALKLVPLSNSSPAYGVGGGLGRFSSIDSL